MANCLWCQNATLAVKGRVVDVIKRQVLVLVNGSKDYLATHVKGSGFAGIFNGNGEGETFTVLRNPSRNGWRGEPRSLVITAHGNSLIQGPLALAKSRLEGCRNFASGGGNCVHFGRLSLGSLRQYMSVPRPRVNLYQRPAGEDSVGNSGGGGYPSEDHDELIVNRHQAPFLAKATLLLGFGCIVAGCYGILLAWTSLTALQTNPPVKLIFAFPIRRVHGYRKVPDNTYLSTARL